MTTRVRSSIYVNVINSDFSAEKKKDFFSAKIYDILLFLKLLIVVTRQNRPSCRGGSNEIPKFMFWLKNKKNMYMTVNLCLTI